MKKNGKIIVLEGLDGSGKCTQSKILFDNLKLLGKNVKVISMPNYDSESSGPIKMYLRSKISSDPNKINPYATSSFFAVDRFINYFCDWKLFYNDKDSIIVCDRYTTSNMIYQLAKVEYNKWDSFLTWLDEYEYKYLQIPRPDLVIYLKVPLYISHKLIQSRSTSYDLHESNLEFLRICEKAAEFSSRRFNWQVIDCALNNKDIMPIEKISSKILQIVKKYLP